MTSTALLKTVDDGNAEAALLHTDHEDESDPFVGTLYRNEAFEFSLSEPVDSLESLTVRDQSYEGWESLQPDTDTQLELLDARLTKPDSEEVSELILRLDGLEGSHSLDVRTIDDTAHLPVEADLADSEVSVRVESDTRAQWATAVITAAVPDLGVESNPRRVNEESRAYHREFREMTRSDGTRSSTTLLKQILQNPDTDAINVFDVALSELRRHSGSQPAESDPEQEARHTFEERTPARLIGSSPSTPPIRSLVEHQLNYQLTQATDALDYEDIPTSEEVESFLDHLGTFFESIELCLVLDIMDELNNDKVLDECRKAFREFLDLLPHFTSSISRLADLIEDNPQVEEAFINEDGTDPDELAFWGTAFDLFYIHPAIILELDHNTPEPVIRSHNQFANELKSTLNSSDPALWRYLFDYPYLQATMERQRQNLEVRYADDATPVSISGDALQAILLYILVQNSQSDPDYLANVAAHPRYSERNIRRLARFALDAEGLLFDYGLVSDQMWNIVLKQGREALENFTLQ